ncbi:MAG TPA: flavodoxin reductase [Edaphocola sp.]|nr:flavodoxin reductase [Edaphocola sp.]
MEEHIVRILDISPLTHDVRRIRVEKPAGYQFTPGQATEVAVNEGHWKEDRRPFTFTCLNEDPYLEFSIKIYSDHAGVTKKIGSLHAGDELIIHDVWGAIQYKGEGTFIAGGAGITPFIAIFRQLQKDGKIGNNRLLFANKTRQDIILNEDFKAMLGKNFINVLSNEKTEQYDYGMITKDYLKEKIGDVSQNFYICGPDPMVRAMQENLKELGATESVITVEV